MNHILLDVFSKLTVSQKTELRNSYKDSAIGLRMFDFLERVTGADFKTADAVKHVYSGAIEKYNVLENRYFKLRKKILDDINAFSKDDVIPIQAEEEAALSHCKYLLSIGDKKEAYKRLTELERLCWERNIFELLPSILDNLIFCNQAFNELDKNQALYKRMEEAGKLQYDITRVNIISRQVYDVFFTKGITYAKAQFNSLKELAEKNKQYPRFLMCYHYMSMYYKASAPEYFDNSQVVSRHLTEFKKLYNVHPHVPMMNYRANYAKHFHFHFNHITAIFHNNRCEFEDAYQCVKKTWEVSHSSDSVYKQYRTEAVYTNMFNTQAMTARYKEAIETINVYSKFLKDNNKLDRPAFANVLKAIVYVSAWPQTFKMDSAYLHEQVDEYIKQVKKHDNIEFSLAQTFLLKAQLFLLDGKADKANALVNKKEVGTWLTELKAQDLVAELMDIVCSTNSAAKLAELLKKFQHRKLKASNSEQFRLLHSLINYLNFCLKNSKKEL